MKYHTLLGLLHVGIRSEACADPGKHGSCGKAFIWVNGRDLSRHRRGLNVAVLDYFTGKACDCVHFDQSSCYRYGDSSSNKVDYFFLPLYR